MKKWIIVAILIILPIAWYLLSPLFIVVELNEESPLASLSIQGGNENQVLPATTPVETVAMGPEDKAALEKQMEEMKDKVKEMQDDMPAGPSILSVGTFLPKAHEVEGKALLIQSEGKKILRFEDFHTVNGPELHIYLSTGAHDDDFVDLGIIKATKGNVNYEIPGDIDTEKYDHVLVWCKPFGVLFSYAPLS